MAKSRKGKALAKAKRGGRPARRPKAARKKAARPMIRRQPERKARASAGKPRTKAARRAMARVRPAKRHAPARRKASAAKPPARKHAKESPRAAPRHAAKKPLPRKQPPRVFAQPAVPAVPAAPQLPKSAPAPALLPPPAAGQMPVAEPKASPPHIDASEHREGPLAVEIQPALEMLPGWEDRLRLRRVIFEDGLRFYSVSRSSKDFIATTLALEKCGKPPPTDTPGYFMVCAKGRDNGIIGAMDGHFLGGTLVIHRSCASGSHRRETHILLYSAALSGHEPGFVLFSFAARPMSVDMAALIILLGRGFGFSALPGTAGGRIILIRRMKRELDPVSDGREIRPVLDSAKGILGIEGADVGALSARSPLPLIPLPFSPDSREHLHELRDFVSAAGLPSDGFEAVLERLRTEYVLARKDLTPEALH